MKKQAAGQKDILNQEEAIVHFELSRSKFYKLLKNGKDNKFVAKYGSRRLIIQSEFEKYLTDYPELKRRGS